MPSLELKILLLFTTKKFFRNLSLVVFTLVTVSNGLGEGTGMLKARKIDGLIAKVTAGMISKQHYLGRRLNDEISIKLFEKYLEALDANKYYFYESDIARFSSYKILIDDLLIQGQIDFALQVYNVFAERVQERVNFTQNRLKTPFDFSVEEEFDPDRSESQWCKNEDELDEAWRLRLKHELLNRILIEDQHEKVKNSQKVKVEPESKKELEKIQEKETPSENKNSNISEISPEQYILKKYQDFIQRIQEKDSMDVLEIFLSSLARVFDPHSTYMAPITKENFDISMKHSLEGIGATLSFHEGYVKLTSIIPGGPADRDGRLKDGDIIVAVAQENKEPVDIYNLGLRNVVGLIRGPKGTFVTLSIIEAGKETTFQPVKITLERDKINLADRGAKLQILSTDNPSDSPQGEKSTSEQGENGSKNIALISLPSFYTDFEARNKGKKEYKSSTQDVIKLIDQSVNKGVSGLIMDLRTNSGGSLDESISLAGLFFPEGPVVQVRHHNGKIRTYNDEDGKTYYDGPLIVLVDKYSASASEIFAAAIQDHGRGIILGGQSTHGKGTVQTLHSLKRVIRNRNLLQNNDPGSLKITTAKFYRVNGGSTQIRGVTSDIIVPSFRDKMEIGESSLEGALEWDTIAPIAVASYAEEIRSFIPILNENFLTRLEGYEWYKPLLADIDRFSKWTKQKVVSLNKDKRILLGQREKEWSKIVKSYKLRKSKKNSDPKEDIILNEALVVMSDLFGLIEEKNKTKGDQSLNEPLGIPTKM